MMILILILLAAMVSVYFEFESVLFGEKKDSLERESSFSSSASSPELPNKSNDPQQQLHTQRA